MINFSRAFDTAWERMVIILFRPFDPGKWFVIGFSAFLAGLMQGGNGFNGGSFNNFSNINKPGTNNQLPSFDIHQLHSHLSHLMMGVQVGMIIVIAAVVFFIVFAVLLVFYWLGAHGQFLFLDNIVRNRGAVSWPWQQYFRQANSLFGFYVLLIVLSFAVFLPILGIALVMCIPLFQQNRWPVSGEIAGFVVLGMVYMALAIIFSILLFTFREFGVPLMFRRGILARPAFMESLKLIRDYPGSVFVFILLRIALAIAVAILSILTCCACCIGLIPYLGTVAILPGLIYIRCFTLDCLAQFGPDYDVWTIDVPPTGPASPLSVSPPLPL